MKHSIKTIVEDSVNGAGATKWPTFDGKFLNRQDFVTASEVGSCLRKIWFEKNTVASDAPPETWGYFQRGHNVEAWIVEKLRARVNGGVTFMMIGDQQVSFHKDQRSGTPDGIMVTEDGNYLFDIKSFDPRTNVKNFPKQPHIDQVLYNIDLVHACTGMTFLGGKLLYVDASNYQRQYEYDVVVDEQRTKELRERAVKVMAAGSAESVPSEGIYNGGCTYCSFGAQCSAAVEQKNETEKTVKKHRSVAKNVFG